MNDLLKEKLKSLPTAPGVYFHKSADGEIIYVGKAAVLKNRVRQYFQSKKDFDVKTLALVNEIADTDWVETESEVDALFLESEMVKRYMPRYNILLRDDKSQTFIRIDMKSDWPTVTYTRNPADDGADYYGPYYNGFAIKKALRYLRRVFPYYTKTPQVPRRPDLDVHLGLSPSLKMSSTQYKAELKKLVQYIKGGRVKLVKEIEAEMKRAAKEQSFEAAAVHRNRLYNLRELQHKIMFGDKEFVDISKDKALAQLQQLLQLPAVPARIEGYDISHLSGTDVVASMVVFTNGVSNRAEYRKFKIHQQRNDDTASMAEAITRRFSDKNIKAWGVPQLIIVDGGKGQLHAAAEVLRQKGLAIPIIGVAKNDELVMVHAELSNIATGEVVATITNPPAGVYTQKDGDYYSINLHAGQQNAGGHSKNLRGGGGVYAFSDTTKLVQRIRDESHRFAVSYHTTLRRTAATKSTLEDIAGIGPVTRKKLLKKFGSMRGVKQASHGELAAVIGPVLATRIQQNIDKT